MIIALVIFYFTATMGGLKGVAWTDMIQSVIIFITVAVVAVISARTIADNGGLSALPANLLNPLAANMPWKTMAGNIVSSILMSTVMQSLLVQRINACKNPLEAKKATVLNGIACGLFMVLGIGVIGLASNFTTGPEVTGNGVITEVLSQMPMLLGAFYAAAIIAAVLTTANSLLLSCSMTFVRDFIGEFKPLNDRQELRASRVFILVVDVLAFIVVRYSSSVIGWIMITYTVLACLCIPLYGGLFFKKSTPLSGVLSLALGGGAAILWEILSKFGVLPADLAALHSIFPGIAFGLIGLILGFFSKTPSSPEQLRVVDCFKQNKLYVQEAEAEAK